jgi:2-dehydropantoate 2-reductase
VAVAQAAGVDADQRRVIAAVDYAFRHHQQHKPSMLQDVEAGRKTEIDFINGAVVERGKRLGVATPVLEMLFSLVKLSEG